MSYKTILVHADAGERWPVRLQLAIGFARRFDAHLVALHALSAVRIPAYAMPEIESQMAEGRRRAEEQARQAEAMFRRSVELAGLPNAEWRTSRDDAAQTVPLHARYCDLVVIGQPDREHPCGVEPDFAHRLVLSAGRPVLAVPYAGRFETTGQRILLAWNGRREATRAATDALPLLRLAETVTIVCVNPESDTHGELPGADIALYLARHGVHAEVSNVQHSSLDAGNQLLSYAADLSADLIVMGAYGHSRMSELVLGGVTRTLISTMTVPVLMSH
jgi:nucleotide-binding universal stress UspA family protein